MNFVLKKLFIALLITFSFLAVSKVAIASGNIINAEFKCMPYQGGHIRGYSHLTENPFGIIEPKEIRVVVKGDEVQVKHLSTKWKTLRRDKYDVPVPWVAASTDDLYNDHMHIRLDQESDTFKWKFQLVRNGSMQVIAIGACQKK